MKNGYTLQKNKNKPFAVPSLCIEDASEYLTNRTAECIVNHETRLNVKYTLVIGISGIKEKEVTRFLRQTKDAQGSITIRQGALSWVFKNAYLESEREFTDEFTLEVSNPQEIEA